MPNFYFSRWGFRLLGLPPGRRQGLTGCSNDYRVRFFIDALHTSSFLIFDSSQMRSFTFRLGWVLCYSLYSNHDVPEGRFGSGRLQQVLEMTAKFSLTTKTSLSCTSNHASQYTVLATNAGPGFQTLSR